MKRGLVHIYTGDGKGKTTASVGLAVRAAGRGMKVLYCQLFKEEAGETEMLRKIGIPVRLYSEKHPYFRKYGREESEAGKRGCLEFVRDAFAEAKKDGYGMLVIDEFGPALSAKWLSVEDAVQMIKAKPEGLELVLTGRGFPDEVLALADYHSEIRKVRHPYEKGVQARKGIED